jgi:hypothetical protein
MPLTIRPYRRFPVQCSVTYNAGLFLKLPLASCSNGSTIPRRYFILVTLPYPEGFK